MADIFALNQGAYAGSEIYLKEHGRPRYSMTHGHYVGYRVIYSTDPEFEVGSVIDGRRYARFMEELTDQATLSMLYLIL